MNEQPQLRKNILELLELIASEDGQLAYERDVPNVDITAELVCMWFDDQYHPGDWRLPLAFSAAELATLDHFHESYAARKAQLPESNGTVRTWLVHPVWREIMGTAKQARENIRKAQQGAPDQRP